MKPNLRIVDPGDVNPDAYHIFWECPKCGTTMWAGGDTIDLRPGPCRLLHEPTEFEQRLKPREKADTDER